MVLVGEQPGDVEDLQGRPFVGPAGKVLNRALEEAGIDRSLVYVTNAVKHFRFVQRGKRRIHAKPGREHIEACHPWLEKELAELRPSVVVALGATAVQALLGSKFRVLRDRGTLIPFGETQALITIHPSAVLRMAPEERKKAQEGLVADLRVAAEAALAPR
jgi:uracil-DNA glycosylase family protein